MASLQFKFNHPDASLPWSGRAYDRYGNYVQQITRLDGHPFGPNAWSFHKEITCSGRATVWTIVPHRPDAALKQERSSSKFLKFWSYSCPFRRPLTTIRTAPSFIKPDAHLSPQPINRGPCAWELKEFGIEFHHCLESYFVRLLSWFVLSEAVDVCVVAALKLKSILGVGLKVKNSIEDPFK